MTEKQKPNPPSLNEIWAALQSYLYELIRLDIGVDKEGTIQEIKSNKTMNGPNAWMLMCSIVIASIGLSRDSQAVIIGAMLISPLMFPILGIGLAVGINDRSALFKSLKHLGIAVAITLITSTLYFYFTPFPDITPAIEERTQPTFLDIIIAVFGGIAGIVSIARKDISTTLPGVAIATALMPPLCVTGFGIANGNTGIASTSFYLFFLNTFFVALSTYFMVKLFKFPLRRHLNREERLRDLYTVGIISLAAVIPSFFIFRGVVNEVRTEVKTAAFIKEYIGDDEIYLDEYEIVHSDSVDWLVLKVYGKVIGPAKIPEYNKGLETNGLHNTRVKIIPTSEVDISDVATLETKISNIEKIAAQLEAATKEREEQEQLIDMLAASISDVMIDSSLFNQVSNELHGLFPELQEIGLAKAQKSDFNNYQKQVPVALLKWRPGLRSSSIKGNEAKVNDFLKERLNLDTLILVRT